MVRAITSAASHSSNRRTRRANGNGNPNAATGTENAVAAGRKAGEAEATRIATLTAETPGADPKHAAKVAHLLTANTEAEREKILLKATLMGTARQALAEAQTYWAAGDDKAKEAQDTSERGLSCLYQARARGLITSTEMSDALGDIFGFKRTKDGKVSKTPDGQGEVIRKRLVRAVAAKEFVETGDGGRFFAGVPKEMVAPVVERLDANDLSCWRAYVTLADIKREASDGNSRVDPAFNPKVIAGIVERLGKPDARQMIGDNPALVPIYAALLDELLVLDGQKAKTTAAEAMDAAEKAAKQAANPLKQAA